MYFAPFLTGRSLKTCARYAGGKDHATGSYARKTIRNGLDPRFKSNYLPAVEGLNAIFENKYGIKVDKNAYIDPLDLGKN